MVLSKGAKVKIHEAILESLVVNQLGYNDLSIAGICRKAGITRKTFYNHFSNKDAAARSLVEVQINKLISQIDDYMESNSSFDDKMHFFKLKLMESYQHEFTRDLLDRLKADAPHILEEHNKRLKAVFQKMAGLIEEGQKEGRIKQSVDPQIAVVLLHGAALTVNLHDYVDMTVDTTEQAISQAYDIILTGIMSK